MVDHLSLLANLDINNETVYLLTYTVKFCQLDWAQLQLIQIYKIPITTNTDLSKPWCTTDLYKLLPQYAGSS